MLVILNRNVLIWIAGITIAVLFLRQLGTILLPFVLGAALAYFLDPLADRLERLRFSRASAVAIIAIVLISLMTAAVLLLLPTLIGQLRQLVEALPNAVRGGFDRLMARFPELMEDGGFLRQILSDLTERLRMSALAMLGGTLSTVISALAVGVLFIATLTVTIYLLYDWDRLVAGVDRRLPPKWAPLIRHLARDIDGVLTGFVRGQIIVGALLATFYSTVLMTLGLNYGLLIGIASGLLNFIPYLGSISGFGLATGVALVQFWGNWWMIALVAFVFILGQMVEGNVITPRIVGDSVKLHPVWMLLALASGGALFGFAGLLLAVPFGAALGVVVRYVDTAWLLRLRRQKRALARRP
ncbi:AI-2E family transporter [Paracoccus sp. Z118]|uniref:AI-2E family transporter n=1 Tax=Paracoccus sp. Z118 TaxID=2851017 RepID=UPI001C2C7F4F|nr:AI-2E family transporter [Paracoccus sp. Z118]MBV0892166.1 AI-2E family transporter [Paracoccus sp. Z118]